jgi:hypothetical protein
LSPRNRFPLTILFVINYLPLAWFVPLKARIRDFMRHGAPMNRLTNSNANFSGSTGATVSGTAARALAAAVRFLLTLTLSAALTAIAFAGP